MGSPEISILMSIKDQGKYLKKCIESILSQDFENFEFLIINDASIDETSDILYLYASIDKRIKIFTIHSLNLEADSILIFHAPCHPEHSGRVRVPSGPL